MANFGRERAGWLAGVSVRVCVVLSVATTNLFQVFRFLFHHKICKIIRDLMVVAVTAAATFAPDILVALYSCYVILVGTF